MINLKKITNFTKDKRFLVIASIIIIIITFTVFSSHSPYKSSTQNTTDIISPTPSEITPTTQDFNPYEATEEWNNSFKQQENDYKQSDEGKSDSVLSQIRTKNIISTDFQIKYDYSNSTYTITATNSSNLKETVHQWFIDQGVAESTYQKLRIKFTTP